MNFTLVNCEARHPAAKPGDAAALRGVSLAVAPGEQVAIIGPSGAGKTTLLHVLACAIKPSLGELKFGEINPWAIARPALQRLRAHLFLAVQVPPLPPRQRVVTAVLAGCLPAQSLLQSVRSLFYPTQMELARAALARFDLEDKLFERVDHLSGGERQRVGLARGVVSNAQLFLVDEPLSALDPTRAAQAIHSLIEVAGERGATLIASLHQVDIALQNFPRVVGLRDGVVAFDLPAAQISPAMIQALYAHKLHELTEPIAAPSDAAPAQGLPAVMHCR